VFGNGIGFWVLGSAFRVLGFRVWGLGRRIRNLDFEWKG
jgi:hypothetical protein